MLVWIQCVYYVEGWCIVECLVLFELGVELGFGEGFVEVFDVCFSELLCVYFVDSWWLMNCFGVVGFLIFVLECDGCLQVFDIGCYFGQLDDWWVFFEMQLCFVGGSGVVGGVVVLFCCIDGCV